MAEPRQAPGRAREPFWRSAAGAVTAILSLIAAVIGVFTVIVQMRGTGGERPSPVASSTTPAAAPQAATSPVPQPGSETPVWGPAKQLYATGLDLDTEPPAGGETPAMDIYGRDRLYAYPLGNMFARWVSAAEPTRAGCDSLMKTYGLGNAAFDKGDRFCIRSGKGRIALMEFIGRIEGGWEVNITIWKSPN